MSEKKTYWGEIAVGTTFGGIAGGIYSEIRFDDFVQGFETGAFTGFCTFLAMALITRSFNREYSIKVVKKQGGVV